MSSPKKLKPSPHLPYDEEFEEIYKLVSEYTVVGRPISDWEEMNLLAGITSSSLSDSLQDVSMDTASVPAQQTESTSSSSTDLMPVADDLTDTQQTKSTAAGEAPLIPVIDDLTVIQQPETTTDNTAEPIPVSVDTTSLLCPTTAPATPASTTPPRSISDNACCECGSSVNVRCLECALA